MLNFDNLVNDISKVKDSSKVDEYLIQFFSKQNYKEYQIDEACNKDEIKAIKTMFESKKDLMRRVDEAFKYDPFCIEAFFTYLMKTEDTFLNMRFNAYYDELSNFADFTDYEKKCYIKILNFYVDFLLDIKNITGAIKIQKVIIKLTNNTREYLNRLASMFFELENEKELYQLYCQNDFSTVEYIWLIITELKHEEELKAQEVLLDMFEKIECASYLDHIWDLDENDPIQKAFYDELDNCFDDILAIPNFFSWVNQTREKYCK